MSKNGFWLLWLLPLAGCGMTGMRGNWVLKEVIPAEAIGHYDIAAVTFNPDCTYVAKVRKGDRTEVRRGTYDYDPWSRKLTLRSGGVERSYTATLWLGLQINVKTQTPEGEPLTAILGRTKQAVAPPPPTIQRRTR